MRKPRQFVVTWKSGDDDEILCRVMTGYQLAGLYGFSDCSGDEVLKVWEVYSDGSLIPCEFWGNYYYPMNVLMVHRLGNYEPYEYEWDEH